VRDRGHKTLPIRESIRESYVFFSSHFLHFLRLATPILLLWIIVDIFEVYIEQSRGVRPDLNFIISFLSAGFSLVWYRLFISGPEDATYWGMLTHHFRGRSKSSAMAVFRSVTRLILLTVAILVPTLLLSIMLMLFLTRQGAIMTPELIRQMVFLAMGVAFLLLSPVLARISLYTVSFVLGRKSLQMRDVWRQTRGYTLPLWGILMRAFLPYALLVRYSEPLLEHLSLQWGLTGFGQAAFITLPVAFLSLMMLAIMVGANAEAFRKLIGMREGDAPHRPTAGPKRTAETAF
tara:strand:+ start:2662 stop:3534 length:873 start_codon:yes stop_codon:yes gene_type:complete